MPPSSGKMSLLIICLPVAAALPANVASLRACFNALSVHNSCGPALRQPISPLLEKLAPAREAMRQQGSFKSPVKPKVAEEWAGEPLPSVVIVTSEPLSGLGDQVAPIAVAASNVSPYLAVVPPNAPAGPQRWASGLCDCCDVLVPNCCMAWLCPCVALAQVYARIGALAYSSALWRLSLWVVPYLVARLLLRHAMVETTSTPSYVYTVDGKIYETETVTTYSAHVLWLSYLFLLLGHVLLAGPVWLARGRTRAMFQLPGDACGDCCVSWWCTNCAIAQLATHVGSYRPGNCSFNPPAVLPAYVS